MTAAEKRLCGHLFATSWGDELVDDEVIAVGELLVEGGVRFVGDMGGSDDQFEVVKGQFGAWKTEVGTNAGFGLSGGEFGRVEQGIFFGE